MTPPDEQLVDVHSRFVTPSYIEAGYWEEATMEVVVDGGLLSQETVDDNNRGAVVRHTLSWPDCRSSAPRQGLIRLRNRWHANMAN
jgi:hypothetical protein